MNPTPMYHISLVTPDGKRSVTATYMHPVEIAAVGDVVKIGDGAIVVESREITYKHDSQTVMIKLHGLPVP